MSRGPAWRIPPSNAAATRAAGLVSGLTKGLHNLRLQSRDNAPFEVLHVNVSRATSGVPTVEAGPDQTLRLPQTTATLDGTVTDPDTSPTGRWSLYAGPAGASVAFGNANAVDTTAHFDRPGDYVLALTATDGPLTATDLVAIRIEPAGDNKALNSGFDNAAQFVPTDTWIESATDTGRGWMVVNDSRWNLDQTGKFAYADSGGYRTMAQIIRDDGGSRGWQLLGFRAKNLGTGNKLNVHVFGVNADSFKVPLADERGPLSTDGQATPVGTPLVTAEVGGEYYDWSEFRYPVDTGDGYKFLVLLVYSDGVGSTESQAIDDLRFSGGTAAADNVLVDGAFAARFTAIGSWVESGHDAGLGWLIASGTNTKWNRDAGRGWATADNSGVPTMAQVIHDQGRTRGLHRVAIESANDNAAGQLKLYVWGVREPFRLNLYNLNGPRKVDSSNWNIPADCDLLLADDALGGEAYEWVVTDYPNVDSGTGYDYLVVQIYTNGADPAQGRTQKVDNVVIGGNP